MRAWKWPAAYLTVMALIAMTVSLASRYLARETCEMDGQTLPVTLRVDLKMADGVKHSFCSIECARRWLANQPNATAKEAVVRDRHESRQRQRCARLPRPHRRDGTHPPLRWPRDQ